MGWGFLLVSLPLLVVNVFIGVILMVLGALIIFTEYKIQINLDFNNVQEFMSIAGIILNSRVTKFNETNYVFIKSKSYSQKMQLRAANNTMRTIVYEYYLSTDTENFFLGESKSLDKIKEKADKLAGLIQKEVKMPD